MRSKEYEDMVSDSAKRTEEEVELATVKHVELLSLHVMEMYSC